MSATNSKFKPRTPPDLLAAVYPEADEDFRLLDVTSMLFDTCALVRAQRSHLMALYEAGAMTEETAGELRRLCDLVLANVQRLGNVTFILEG